MDNKLKDENSILRFENAGLKTKLHTYFFLGLIFGVVVTFITGVLL